MHMIIMVANNDRLGLLVDLLTICCLLVIRMAKQVFDFFIVEKTLSNSNVIWKQQVSNYYIHLYFVK
jgi:hypothetical protein